MAVKSPYIPLVGGNVARIWKHPWETWTRRRSDAAMISDKASQHQAILLCASCEAKLPKKWTARYGYRLLHNMHTEGHCDYCRTYASGNLYHHEDEGYCRQWVQQTAHLDAAREQQIAIRDKRRIRGLD